jgi:hypothetical protein
LGERLSGPKRYAKSAASLGRLPVGVGKRRSRAALVTAKAMEGVEILDCSPEEPPGV